LIAKVTNKSKVESYVRGVLDGEIVAGVMVRAAINRHVRDLQRVDDPDFPYEMDWRKAEFACNFFPMFLRHSKGEWAGHPFELAPWQMFVVASVFGWLRKSDGKRRFRKAYVSIGRKNGKSTSCAGIALLLLILDSEAGAEVFVAATKREQARIIHNEAKRMVRSSPDLLKLCKVHQGSISVDSTNSFFQPTSSDRPRDGDNPHGVIFDELHAWREQHRDFYETMTTGGASRTQPLEVTVTTAGNEKSLLWQEAEAQIRDIVQDFIKEDTVFGFICEIDKDDDPFDEAVWPKANPGIGESVKLSYLRQQASDAKSVATKRNSFVRYHCNRVVSSVEEAITHEAWDACQGELSDWNTADYIGGGVDIGGHDDLAAYAICARFPDGEEVTEDDDGNEVTRQSWRYEIKSRSFLYSKCTRQDKTKQPWAQWIHDGHITECDMLITEIRDQFAEEARGVGCGEFAYDKFQAKQMATELENDGFTAAEMPQNYIHYNEPMRAFLLAVSQGRIRHNGCPVLRWAAMNLCIKEGGRNDWMPAKKTPNAKIDPIVAAIMAFRMAYVKEAAAAGSMFIPG